MIDLILDKEYVLFDRYVGIFRGYDEHNLINFEITQSFSIKRPVINRSDLSSLPKHLIFGKSIKLFQNADKWNL